MSLSSVYVCDRTHYLKSVCSACKTKIQAEYKLYKKKNTLKNRNINLIWAYTLKLTYTRTHSEESQENQPKYYQILVQCHLKLNKFTCMKIQLQCL